MFTWGHHVQYASQNEPRYPSKMEICEKFKFLVYQGRGLGARPRSVALSPGLKRAPPPPGEPGRHLGAAPPPPPPSLTSPAPGPPPPPPWRLLSDQAGRHAPASTKQYRGGAGRRPAPRTPEEKEEPGRCEPGPPPPPPPLPAGGRRRLREGCGSSSA